MHQRVFRISFEDRILVGDDMTCGQQPSVLVLHGGGQSTRRRFDSLRKQFLAAGIGSCAFDFAGSGESTGNTGDTSLEHRTRQAERVIAARQLRPPLAIFGASMGAYTAVKLLESRPVSTLVLLVPAMYTAEAYRVPFAGGFTDLIRAPDSWEKSDAWQLLSGFRGNLLVVAAGRDRVIPDGVIDRIMDAGRQNARAQLLVVPEAPHQVLSHLAVNAPRRLERVVRRIVEVIKAGTD